MKKQPAKGHTAKHSQTKKHSAHHKTKKHHPQRQVHPVTHQHHQKVHTAAKGAKGHKPHGLALAEGVACCTAEALAASLRLTGRPVSAADVLALYRHTADGPDVFTTIPATLEAAYRWGLAGIRPVSFAPVDLDDPAALILGVDLPGPHAVAAAGGWWFSWGDHYPPSAWPDALVEEAWGVTWP